MFVASSAAKLDDSGVLVAVVPESLLFTEKDRSVRCWLQDRFSMEVVENNRNGFTGARVRTSILRLTRRVAKSAIDDASCADCAWDSPLGLKIERGRLPVYLASRRSRRVGVPFVHTTSFTSGTWEAVFRLDECERDVVNGPGVLVPRVTAPRPRNLVVVRKSERMVLSDCLILIRTGTLRGAQLLRNHLVGDLTRFRAIYRGTGAQFVTLARLEAYIRGSYSEIERGAALAAVRPSSGASGP